MCFISIVGIFIYVTNDAQDSSSNNDYLSQAILSSKDNSKSNSSAVANDTVSRTSEAVHSDSIKTLDSILPNSSQMQDSEILEEAELLLSMNQEEMTKDGLFILNILSKRQNVKADVLLAQFYDKGLLVEKDSKKAMSLYEKSALNGSEDSNIYLFNYYLDNDDVSHEHFQRALDWFQKAANTPDNPIANYALAHMYQEGLGVDVSMQIAEEYYKKAADQNFVLAYERLGDLYLNSQDPKKVTDALMLFQRSANEDIPAAQYKLGYMYETGLGAKQDYETAKFWYSRAANNNLIKAYLALGLLYESGLGVEKDNLEAYKYYRIAAEAGDAEGQNAVARSFERGLGVDQDLERAVFWYAKSAEQKNGNAEYNLGRIFEEYDSVRNIDDAKEWYQRAAKSNVFEATNALQRLEKQ